MSPAARWGFFVFAPLKRRKLLAEANLGRRGHAPHAINRCVATTYGDLYYHIPYLQYDD